MAPYAWIVGGVLGVALVAELIARLTHRPIARWVRRRDTAVWDQAFARHGGRVVKFADYDQTKAVAGRKRWVRQTETGRKYRPTRRREAVSADVVPFRSRGAK